MFFCRTCNLDTEKLFTCLRCILLHGIAHKKSVALRLDSAIRRCKNFGIFFGKSGSLFPAVNGMQFLLFFAHSQLYPELISWVASWQPSPWNWDKHSRRCVKKLNFYTSFVQCDRCFLTDWFAKISITAVFVTWVMELPPIARMWDTFIPCFYRFYPIFYISYYYGFHRLKAVAPLEIEKSAYFHLSRTRDSSQGPLKHGTTV